MSGKVAAHSVPTAALLEQSRISRTKGLSTADVARLRDRYGLNQLHEAAAEPWLIKLLRQFKSAVVAILLVAAVFSAVMGERIETAAILAIVFLNGVIGFLHEARAERALAALRRMSQPQARVIRDATLQAVRARDLVPFDLVELEAGDHVPADVRLIQSFGLKVQEAALTGESEAVAKNADALVREDAAVADRVNMTYLGTTVLAGKALGFVTATGMATELGHISDLLLAQKPEPTPLQRRLSELGRILTYLCIGMVVVIAALQLSRGGSPGETFIFAVSLAVAAVPEGLPATVTVALALGLTRLAKRHALVRRLPSVETLGSVTVICSDKTGTLTCNEMTVRKMIVGNHSYRITGSGYKPRGDFYQLDRAHEQDGDTKIDPSEQPELMLALEIAAWCNDAALAPPSGKSLDWTVVGDPTEGALLVAASKADVAAKPREDSFVHKLPFDAERKMMSVVVRRADGTLMMLSKGAPEALLSKCRAERYEGDVRLIDDERRQEILAVNHGLASDALRTLALAYRELPPDTSANFSEADLTFVGLVGMMDPPRDDVKDAVKKCRTAGIRPVMITGDHPATAWAIAKELGIARDGDEIVTGRELDQMSTEALDERVANISVYARVSPEHKLRVVKAWKKRGDIVAMTGDGVNDAPAVRAADIGIAMGITGTDVTKEASAMVLADDNFASIVNAVEEGRGILNNIQNIVHFLLAGNTSEILLVLLAAVVGWPTPLSAIQILWINLITDGFPALALASERPERGVMTRQSRPAEQSILDWHRGQKILWHGVLLAAPMILGFWIEMFHNPDTAGNIAHAQSVVFCICALGQLSFSLACRSQSKTWPELGVFSNLFLFLAVAVSVVLQVAIVHVPVFQPVFFAEAPRFSWHLWAMIIGLALIPVSIVEISKIVRSRRASRLTH